MPEAQMRPFSDWTEGELKHLFSELARGIEQCLPPGTLFALLTFDPDRIGQYVSNAVREDILRSLREFADRLERNQDVTR